MEIRLPTRNRLVLDALSKHCGSREVLTSLNLTVHTGELVVVLGGAGSGKTTLLRLIAGLTRPSAGMVKLDGLDVTLIRAERRDLSVAFSTPALMPHLSVEANIALSLEAYEVAPHARVRRVEELIDGLQLERIRRLKPAQLHPHERQLAGLARALARDPLAFLLDEPLHGLQGSDRVQFRHRLRTILRNLRATTVVTTRNADDALAIADRVAVLIDGRFAQVDTPEVIRTRPLNESVRDLLRGSTNPPA